MTAHLVTPAGGQEEEEFRFRRAFGTGQSLLLVRPDSYVGFAGRRKALPHLITWLESWFPPHQRQPPAPRGRPEARASR